jgi:hypothetical protein
VDSDPESVLYRLFVGEQLEVEVLAAAQLWGDAHIGIKGECTST